MAVGQKPEGLQLTEEEAFALLGLCLTSPTALDAISEKAVRKLAEYCSDSTCFSFKPTSYHLTRELGQAGA
jgi:hypothetical protein